VVGKATVRSSKAAALQPCAPVKVADTVTALPIEAAVLSPSIPLQVPVPILSRVFPEEIVAKALRDDSKATTKSLAADVVTVIVLGLETPLFTLPDELSTLVTPEYSATITLAFAVVTQVAVKEVGALAGTV